MHYRWLGAYVRVRLPMRFNAIVHRYYPFTLKINRTVCVYNNCILIILLFMNSKGDHEDKLHVIKRRSKNRRLIKYHRENTVWRRTLVRPRKKKTLEYNIRTMHRYVRNTLYYNLLYLYTGCLYGRRETTLYMMHPVYEVKNSGRITIIDELFFI